MPCLTFLRSRKKDAVDSGSGFEGQVGELTVSQGEVYDTQEMYCGSADLNTLEFAADTSLALEVGQGGQLTLGGHEFTAHVLDAHSYNDLRCSVTDEWSAWTIWR